jgi:hemin uptake protein HemP
MHQERQTETRDRAKGRDPRGPAERIANEADAGAGRAAWWADRPPRHDARALTGAGGQAEILLDGTRYVLRITRQHKLILTK